MYTAVLYRTVQNLILFWVQFRYNGWNQMITMSILNWKLYLEDSRIRKKHKLFRRCKYSGATYNTDWLFFILSSLKADWDIQPDPNLKIFFFIYPLSLERVELNDLISGGTAKTAYLYVKTVCFLGLREKDCGVTYSCVSNLLPIVEWK